MIDVGKISVGVVGGGQLGRMMAWPAHRLGVKLVSLDAGGATAPCAQVCGHYVEGGLKDKEKTHSLVKEHGCKFVTTEIEHVNADALQELQTFGAVVEPSPETIRIIQDKYRQKEHFSAKGIALPKYMKTDTVQEVLEAGKKFGYPLMLKARGNSYDGKGNYVVKTADDAQTAFDTLNKTSDRGCYAEGWAEFTMELAVMVVRGAGGEVRSYPVVETEQRDSICHITVCPARISEKSRVLAEQIAVTAVSSLEGRGIYGVELFLMKDGSVLFNEIAPRPHNTGHYTIEASECCQFENHLRAVMGMPLGGTALKVQAAVMLNVLGDADGEEGAGLCNALLSRAMGVRGASVHFYGKADVRKNRKIGHVTVVGDNVAECLARVRVIQGLDAAPAPAPQVGIIMGSDSDLPCMKAAAEELARFGVAYEISIVSAHRTPERMFDYAHAAHNRGIKVIIAGAGGAAHLPGMVAAMTPLPVVGVPVKTTALSGNDSLLSIVQMPKGVPVATVAIDNAANAGLLAVRMLGASNRPLLDKMIEFLAKQEEEVLAKAAKLESVGYAAYLASK
mmetsp:Transcript_18830/g.51865  ORF Transcript_18830/g.51865 Transcript_18830/m.51865 type:complete len:563 (-) Transcript_18830:45-1733(-)